VCVVIVDEVLIQYCR